MVQTARSEVLLPLDRIETLVSPTDGWKLLHDVIAAYGINADLAGAAESIYIAKIQTDPNLWLQFGKDLAIAGDNIFEYIYTPGIGKLIKQKELGITTNEYIPNSVSPLDIKANDELINLLGENEQAFRNEIKSRVREKASQIYELNSSSDDPSWQQCLESGNPLAGWGSVVTNKRRVLGFGEVPQGGEWITKGKCDCYIMASQGAIRFMLPIGVNVDAIKSDSDLHDRFFMNVVRALDEDGIDLIQFEDLDTDAAFRIREQARKLEHAAVFNDDYEGTAWIFWQEKLAAKARSILLNDSFQRLFGGRPIESIPFEQVWPHLEKWLYDESDAARYKGILLLSDSVFIFHGAGSSAIGSARFTRDMLRQMYKRNKIPDDEAEKRIYNQILMTDSKGLLYQGRAAKSTDGSPDSYKEIQQEWVVTDPTLLERIKAVAGNAGTGEVNLEQTIQFASKNLLGFGGTFFITGLTTQPNQFTPEVVASARTGVDRLEGGYNRPVFFASATNPTSQTEIFTREESNEYGDKNTTNERRAQIRRDAYERVLAAGGGKGRFILSTGSPLQVDGYVISQANNVTAFPAQGQAVIYSSSAEVTNEMGEAIALSNLKHLVRSDREYLLKGGINPHSKDIFTITENAAIESIWRAIHTTDRDLKLQIKDLESLRNMEYEEFAQEMKRRFGEERKRLQNSKKIATDGFVRSACQKSLDFLLGS